MAATPAEHWQSLVVSERNSFPDKVQRALLSFISFFYGSAVALRNKAYERRALPIRKVGTPVISVGNLSLGGTGKTALVLWCVENLLAKNKKPAVLSRGYRRNDERGGPRVVSDGKNIYGDARSSGDEPALIANKNRGVPVIVGSERARCAEMAVQKFKPDCLLLDDGFQHRKLHRDLDIVCLDEKMLAAPEIFPRGFLREDVHALKRADFIAVKTKKNEEDFFSAFRKSFSYSPGCPTALFSYQASGLTERTGGPSIPVDHLKGKKVIACSGIAHPDSFQKLIEEQGAVVLDHKRFPDHYSYSERELEEICLEAAQKNAVVVTTEKDRVKMPDRFAILALSVKLNWQKGEADLLNSIMNSMSRNE